MIVAKAVKMEQRFDYESLLTSCVDQIEHIDIYPNKEQDENEDLF